MTDSVNITQREPRAVWQYGKRDAAGQHVSLKIMPRTYFVGVGYQTGVRITGPFTEDTVGLDDKALDELVAVLQRQRALRP